jgi:PmbA protein
MNTQILNEMTDIAFNKAKSLGADDISVISAYGEESMLRFSNNSATIANTLREAAMFVHMSKNRKRVMGTTSSVSGISLEKFVENLFESLKLVEGSIEYVQLPKGPFKFNAQGTFDPRIEKLGEDIVEQSVIAANAALEGGAKRASGVLTANVGAYKIRTSGGVEAFDKGSSITINVRAFTEKNSSGHGLSCAATLSQFSAEEAGTTAGTFAKESERVGHWEEGEYDLIMGPTVAASIVQAIGHSSSIFRIESGTSFLKDLLGRKVAAENFTLEDCGVIEGGFGGRTFDDEGVPTQKTTIIESGNLKTYLHNSTTANKYGVKTTGNAGIIVPHPWNLVVKPGKFTVDEMIGDSKKAIYVTNNWYTRYQNYLTGDYSTLPRDAAFMIESGGIKYAINGIRISDSIPRQMLNIKAIGKEPKWIQWWEVDTPTCTSALLIEKARITKAQM